MKEGQMTHPAVNLGELFKAYGSTINLVPNGTYETIVADASVGSSQGGKLQYNLKFMITSGPYQGRAISPVRLTLSPENDRAVNIFFQRLAAFGLNDQYFAANPSPEQVARDIINKPCRITFEHSSFGYNLLFPGIEPPLTYNNISPQQLPGTQGQYSVNPPPMHQQMGQGYPQQPPQYPQQPYQQPMFSQGPPLPAAPGMSPVSAPPGAQVFNHQQQGQQPQGAPTMQPGQSFSSNGSSSMQQGQQNQGPNVVSPLPPPPVPPQQVPAPMQSPGGQPTGGGAPPGFVPFFPAGQQPQVTQYAPQQSPGQGQGQEPVQQHSQPPQGQPSGPGQAQQPVPPTMPW